MNQLRGAIWITVILYVGYTVIYFSADTNEQMVQCIKIIAAYCVGGSLDNFLFTIEEGINKLQ